MSDGAQTTSPNKVPPPGKGISNNERLIVLCVAMAAFTFQFEAYLVSVSLPDMARELNASSTAISLVVLTYLLGATIALVPAGSLGDRFGLRRTFLAGCAIALIGTLMCGLSSNLLMLWIFRFLQGLGTGAMVATAYAMIPTWIDEGEAGRSYGLLSLGAGVGMVAGLPIGGLLSDALEWRWIFLATAPLFLSLLLLAWLILPGAGQDAGRCGRIDWKGLARFGLILSGIVLVVSLGGELGWTSVPILGIGCATVILVAWSLAGSRTHSPLFSSELLRASGFAPSLAALFIFSVVMSGVRFLMPFYLESSCGLSILMSSTLLLAFPLSYAPTGVWAGHLADQMGSRSIVGVACALGAASCCAFALLLGDRHISSFLLFTVSFGAATGLFFAPNNRFSMSCVPLEKRGEAGALMPVAINLGSLFGVALFDKALTANIPDSAFMIRDGESGTANAVNAFNQGYSNALMLGAVLLLATGLLCLVTYRSTSPESVGSHRR